MTHRAFAVALATLVAAPAAADFTVCNLTEATEHRIAVAWEGPAGAVSKGWWRLAPNDCVTPIALPASGVVHLRGSVGDPGLVETGGEGPRFCVAEGEFEILGAAACDLRGYRSVRFATVETGSGDWYSLGLYDRAEDALPLGRNGPSFATDGQVERCVAVGAGRRCHVQAGLLRLVADTATGTPAPVAEALAVLAPLTPVRVVGDLLPDTPGKTGPAQRVALYKVVPRPGADPQGEIRARLQGRWEAAEGGRGALFVEGGQLELWEGAALARQTLFDVIATCDGAAEGPYLRLQDLAGGPPSDCYRIETLTAGRFRAVTEGGAALDFRR